MSRGRGQGRREKSEMIGREGGVEEECARV
jgi:hypothetical protein